MRCSLVSKKGDIDGKQRVDGNGLKRLFPIVWRSKSAS